MRDLTSLCMQIPSGEAAGGPLNARSKSTQNRSECAGALPVCAALKPGCLRRFPAARLPVVRFVNGRECHITPELFSAEISQQGSCRRLQVGPKALKPAP